MKLGELKNEEMAEISEEARESMFGLSSDDNDKEVENLVENIANA